MPATAHREAGAVCPMTPLSAVSKFAAICLPGGLRRYTLTAGSGPVHTDWNPSPPAKRRNRCPREVDNVSRDRAGGGRMRPSGRADSGTYQPAAVFPDRDRDRCPSFADSVAQSDASSDRCSVAHAYPCSNPHLFPRARHPAHRGHADRHTDPDVRRSTCRDDGLGRLAHQRHAPAVRIEARGQTVYRQGRATRAAE